MIRSYRNLPGGRHAGGYNGARGPAASPFYARGFVAASSQDLARAFAIVMPFTFFCWFVDDGSANGNPFLSAAYSGGQTDYAFISPDGSRHVSSSMRGSNIGGPTTAAQYELNAWNSCCGVFATATSRSVYLNGAGKTTDTTNVTVVNTWDRLSVGALARNSYDYATIKAVACAAVWSVALTDAEVALLNTLIELNGVRGFPAPPMIRPDKLKAFWPISGNSSPEKSQVTGDLDLTVNGGAAVVPLQPPVIYPPSMSWVAGA